MSKRRLLWPPRRKRHNQISQQILIRYVFSVLGMIGGLVLLFFLGWVFCRLFIWQPHEPLYRLLKALEDTAMFWGSGVVLLGVFLLTYRSISKPLDYLDEVIEAAEELAHPADTPIRLSPPLESIQDELNIVREGALRSAMYAKEAEQRKNDLIVYLAHDLKTPLTSVIGYLSLLRDEPQISPEMRAKYTGIALEKAERLEALINEFFEITRFNLTQLSLRLEEVNLTRLLEQVTFEFQPILAEKGLSLSLQFTPDVILACDNVFSITFYVTPSITAIQTPLLASPCLKRRTPSSSLWKTKAVPFLRTNWIKSLNSFFGWIPLVPVLPAALAWGLPLPRRS